LILALPAFSQIDFGLKAGVPFTDAFDVARGARNYRDVTKRFTLGPTVDLRLPFGLGVEFDALYKRYGYDFEGSGSGTVPSVVAGNTRANSWEFPLLLKYRAPGILARPFVSGGVTFHRLTDVKQFVSETFALATGGAVERETSDPPELRDKFRKGFVIGSGLEIRAPLVRVSPEIRYTRWGSDSFLDALNLLRSSRNQAEFLVGFTF
jgi:hypothetical protein